MPKVTIVGNITGDPELRFLTNGAGVATINVAENHRKYDKNTNSYVDDGTTYYKVTAWAEFGEHVTESFKRGDRVVVVGDLRNVAFERKDGTKGTSLEIKAEEIAPSVKYATVVITKSERKSNDGGSNQAGSGYTEQRQAAPSAPEADPWATSDEPPF